MKDKLISIFKNKRIILVLVLVLIALAIGLTTYAIWTTYFSQSDTSSITAKCFKTEFSDGAGINITDMYPTTDTDGMTTTPYNFTISNTCDTVAQYQINIEILNTTTLEEQYVKVALDEEISILSNNEAVTPTLDNASKSYKLKTGILAQGNTKTFDLRTWLDENTTGEQGSNKIFETRVTITTTPVANINFLVVSEKDTGGIVGIADDPFLSSPIDRDKIEEIEFVNHKTIPSTAIGSWDVTVDLDERIMAWYEPTGVDGRYKVTIGSDEQIYANPDSSNLFRDIEYLESLNFNDNFDTSFTVNMENMFRMTGYSSTIFTLNLGSNFDTSKVTNMSGMFRITGTYSDEFTLDLGNKFDTSNVTNMSGMFRYVGSSSPVFTLDLEDKFNTSQVTNMEEMFYGTGQESSGFTLDLGKKFDTSNVTNMQSMFYKTGRKNSIFTLNLGENFNTSNVTNMYQMFLETGYRNPSFTLNLGKNFNMSKVTDISHMFLSAGHNNPNFTIYAPTATRTYLLDNKILIGLSGFNSNVTIIDCNDTSVC